jgi:hypothetical protein
MGLFMWYAYTITKTTAVEQDKRLEHRLDIIRTCNKRCYPYAVDLCYYGDKNNIFIACANDKENIFTEPLK